MNNLHIFLGATVADAAARPLHWVYDPKKLKKYIKGKKDITFMKKNKSPFYSIKTGSVSGYNDVGQVMFKTLVSTKNKSDILKNFKKNIIKNFGPGSAYWRNLKLRKKYKKIKWKGPMNGPWIHQNILETIQNIKSKKNATGGTKVNESDGYCAALPYYLYNDSEKELKKVIRLKKHNHIKVVKKFGKACSYPGTFMGSIHAMITSKNYKTAVIKTIKAGGCNCSRANFVGAYFAAANGVKNIPLQWINKTKSAKSIIK